MISRAPGHDRDADHSRCQYPCSLRAVLLALAAFLALAHAPPALSQVTTVFTLDSDNSSIQEFGTNFSNLGTTNFNAFYDPDDDTTFESGPNVFSYATQFFTPTVSGNYIFGQTEAPVDTVMIVYRGSFDPDNPGDNFLAHNDDYPLFDSAGSNWDGVLPPDIEIVSCHSGDTLRPERCPVVGADLEAGEQYHIVISTFSSGEMLAFPLAFFVHGPAQVGVGGASGGPHSIPVNHPFGLAALILLVLVTAGWQYLGRHDR